VGEVDIDLGDVVGVVGSPASSRRGEPSLAVDELTVLSKNRSPLPDTFHGVTDTETRYRRRYLDLLMNDDARELFLLRTKVVTAIRRYLDAEGFVEVETPVLQPRYGGAFAHPFVTHSNELETDLYLRIATELYLKRLIVGGLERVYEIGKDFRNESVSYKHQPEFTMLEWYEAYVDYQDTMDRIEEMLERVALEVVGTTRVTFREHEIDLKRPWRRVGFVESLDALELWTRDEGELRAWLTERGVDTAADKDWPQLVDHAFGHFVEPSLIEPTIVHGHPVELSPFSRVTDEDEALAERFEYFAAGMELGNAYSEINDAEEQKRRFDEQSAHVEGVRGDPDYVEALSYGMPPTGGLGLGIDRLVMLLSGRETIRDVILFPTLRSQ
jgi:lysyl-tRNA synthetase class 2